MIRGRRLMLPALALAGLFVVSACLGEEATSPSPSPTTTAEPTQAPTPSPTPKPRASATQTLVVIAPEHPRRLLPGDNLNATEKLLIDVLYDPLYRLDENQRPVPELAKDLPEVSADGMTWKIPIRLDAKFHSGEKVKADDVLFSLAVAASPSCSLGRELCATVRNYLDIDGTERDDNTVIIKLTEPHEPFLAEALGRLPIFSEKDVRKATDKLLGDAERLNQERPSNVVADITSQVQRDACFETDPPTGCRLTDHRERLEQIFSRARIDLPSRGPFTDETGLFDEDAYTGELLERMSDLDRAFTTAAADKTSAALGLLDATVRPFGGGPYKLDRVTEDGTWLLQANPQHTRSAPKIENLEIRIEPDPSVATTRLLSGEADWVLELGLEEAAIVNDASGYVAASRPLDRQWGVLFNVRPDRLYFDGRARRAFALCLDHEGLATSLDAGRPVAVAPYTAESWALAGSTATDRDATERDVAEANTMLEDAGWQMAVDGVRVREGVRLSSTIAVRPTAVDLFTFANEAAEQLKECGIELIVEELDLTGNTMLDQLQYPNDFDTLLWQRTLTPDPDSAVRVFESSRITTKDNQADENPSGFRSDLIDHLVASARASHDEAQRSEDYAQIQAELSASIPYWPLWYDSATSAVSDRLSDKDGPIDPSTARYDWDISSWTLTPDGG
jgi:ABC-type transport system substrate-binding protein